MLITVEFIWVTSFSIPGVETAQGIDLLEKLSFSSVDFQ